MTQAMKVKKILSSTFINSEIIKLDSNMSKKGCAYGVRFDCINFYKVEGLLRNANVKYNQILNIQGENDISR